MEPGHIYSWQLEGEKVEVVTGVLFLGSKITAGGDCSHEIRRPLLLGRKAMTDLDDVLKSKDITFPTKSCIVKAMIFSVVTKVVKAGPQRRQSAEELMTSICGPGEDS